jgi:predicted GIY-YIG superfamily endonuclease
MSMYFSIYRIHTDKGVYVGQTSDLVRRMIAHYSCKVWKKGYKNERLPICKSIRETPNDNLKIEELGYYKVSKKSEINKIEKFWISLTGSNLNICHRHKSHTLYLDGSHELEKKLRVDRNLDDKITLDMKYQFDLMMVTHKLNKLIL